jgi:hypothetical protein
VLPKTQENKASENPAFAARPAPIGLQKRDEMIASR